MEVVHPAMCWVKTSEEAGECLVGQGLWAGALSCQLSSSSSGLYRLVPAGKCSAGCIHCLSLPREILSLPPRTGQLQSGCPSCSTQASVHALQPEQNLHCYSPPAMAFFCFVLELQIRRACSALGTISLLSI